MADRTVSGLQDLAVFVAVAESASFTRAAEKLGTGKSNAGKAVQRLESRLGTRLFQRTTRAVRLTEDGETYLQAARAALDGLAGAESALAARRDEPSGRVRMDLPSGLGRLLLPALVSLRRQHPSLSFDVSLTDRQADGVGEGWDIVVRIGTLPDSGDMTVRKLCVLREGLYASPEYLKSRGQVKAIPDLQNHDAAVFRGASGSLRMWRLQEGRHVTEINPPPGIVVSDGQALIDAAVAGFGIASILDKVAQPYLRSGRLARVLPDCDVEGPPVHALVPVGRRMPPKIRVVLSQFAEALKSG